MLPLIMGLAGSGLAGAGMLGGMSALTAGALGSGLGSLMQGDDLGTAIGTGLMSYMGGKALDGLGGFGAPQMAPGAQLGSVTSTTPLQAAELAKNAGTLAGGQGSGAYLRTGLDTAGSFVPSGEIAGQGMSGAMNALTGNLGQTAGIALPGLMAMGQPQGDFKSQLDDEDIPEAAAPNRVQKIMPAGYRGGIDPEFRFFNEGGIASLPYQEGGEMDMSEAPNDKELISDAVDAIQGRSETPEIVLGRFMARYGEEALRDLVERVQSGEFGMNAEVTEGKVNGVGDGMDDMIPATLEGEQDVVLSDGEFIVPADVVSGLGNGSTDAGSKALYEMMDRVRELRTGKREQPEQVPLGNMMPA